MYEALEKFYLPYGSFRLLNRREQATLKKIRQTIIEVLEKMGQCKIEDIFKALKRKKEISTRLTIAKYILLLCVGSFNCNKPPEFGTMSIPCKARVRYKKKILIYKNK